ncbi:MAG: DUF2281 domain-containing protein [Ferruginibacter sp.]
MDHHILYKKISSLPYKEKMDVEAFVDAILEKREEENTVNKAKAGSGKGMFSIIADFDEPLSDFKEYMQ